MNSVFLISQTYSDRCQLTNPKTKEKKHEIDIVLHAKHLNNDFQYVL